MRRLRLTLEYDGTDFQGWQLQAGGRTVQGVVEQAIEKLTQETVRVVAAGRTDAGVHARGQTAHFDCRTFLSASELRKGLNGILPPDAAVRELRDAPPGFHARRDALSKRYVYRIWNTAAPSPLRCRYTWHVRSRLDLDAMREAAVGLQGHHDFAAFRGAPGGAPPEEGTLRTLERLELVREGQEIRLVAEARSFLRYMVRNLTGTLVEVGLGRRSPSQVEALLTCGERSRAAPTAPALGLCLERVLYPGHGPGPGENRDAEPGLARSDGIA